LSIFIYSVLFFFFHHTATTEIYTLSLHDALPISSPGPRWIIFVSLGMTHGVRALILSRISATVCVRRLAPRLPLPWTRTLTASRSEEHTSELQSLAYLVCRLLLEKKKITIYTTCI